MSLMSEGLHDQTKATRVTPEAFRNHAETLHNHSVLHCQIEQRASCTLDFTIGCVYNSPDSMLLCILNYLSHLSKSGTPLPGRYLYCTYLIFARHPVGS